MVFPALKALRCCNSNILAMDKINFLVKRADASIDNSSSMLDDYGCPDTCVIIGSEEE